MSLTISPEQIVAESTSPLLAAPDSWPRTPLGQIATIVNGFPFKSAQFAAGRGKALIRIRDLLRDATTVGFEGEYEERYLVQPGELLIGMDGDFNSARWRGPEALLNQRVCKVVPDSHRLDLDFLTHVLPGYLRAIHDATSSTTVTHLSSGDIAQIPIPLPSLEEQRRLAGIFDIAAAKRGSATLHVGSARRAIERFRQSVLAAACSGRLTANWREDNPLTKTSRYADEVTRLRENTWYRTSGRKRYRSPESIGATMLPDVPETWEWLSADAICSQITDGEHIQPPYRSQGYPMLSAKHVRDGFVDSKGAGLIAKADFEKALERCAPRPGDVLVVSVGATTGRSAVVTDGDPFAIVRSVLLLKPLILSRFFLRWLQSPWAFHWMRQASGASAQPHLYIRDIRKLPVPVPPLSEQREIVTRVDQILALADSMNSRVETADRNIQRNSEAILAKAFRGDLLLELGHRLLPLHKSN